MERGKGADLRRRTFRFACSVLQLHRLLYREEPALRDVSRQATAAATSIGANLEEADAAQSRADFAAKCNISLKEARETRYWLRMLYQCMSSERKRLSPLLKESTELIAILTAIVRKTREAKA